MKGKVPVSGWALLLVLTNTNPCPQEIKGKFVNCSVGEQCGSVFS